MAGSPQTVKAVRRALKSADGARRHARNKEQGRPPAVRGGKGGVKVSRRKVKELDEPEHQHGAGCWPGCENEFECNVMQAFAAMREALRDLSEDGSEARQGIYRICVRSMSKARAALALADEVMTGTNARASPTTPKTL